MKRKTRFNDGGLNRNPFQGDDIDPFSAVRDEEGNIKKGDIPEAEPRESVGRMEGLPTKPQSFKQAFAEAEDGSTFTWNGKSYKKEYASSAKIPSMKDVSGGGRGMMAGRRSIDDIMRDAGGGGRGRSIGRTAEDEITYTPGKGSGRAEIPVESDARGPAKQFSSAMEMGETGRNISTTLGALGGMGRAVANAPRAISAAQTAKEMGRGMAEPLTRAAKEGLEVAAKSGPRAGMETAKSTLSGMRSRAEIQAARAARQKSEAEALEKAKPVLKARKSDKTERASRTRRSDEDSGIEFSKGGSASRRADGCAVRGKTRGRIY